jgi:hypothetical protein
MPKKDAFDWNHVPMILRVIGGLVTLIVVTAGAVGAYYAIVSRIDRLDDRMISQGKTLESLAGSVKVLAEKAATQEEVDAKIEKACLQMQVANADRGWVCPFTPADLQVRVKRRAAPAAPAAPTQAKAGTAPSLFKLW